MRNLASLSLVVALAGCEGGTRTIEVEVPITNTIIDTVTLPIDTNCEYDADNNPTLCRLAGVLTGDNVLTNDRKWLLVGGVFVGDAAENPATLTIEPGTTILGDTVSRGFLVIRRNSQIIAAGTPTEPIVFTSAAGPGNRARADWGGLVINGNAPLNTCPTGLGGDCTAIGEGGSGRYGGTVADDNSGVLQYVRVEFGGYPVTPDDELNGIAFQGVGSGTTVDHVQVHMGGDDGMEFFGGTVNVKNILLTGALDDSFDWTFGYSGKAQFVVTQQYGDVGNNGIEADNNGSTSPSQNNFLPRATPTLSNFTLIGTNSATITGSNSGALLREGTAGELHSFVIAGWDNVAGSVCLQLNQAATVDQVTSGALTIDSSIVDCNTNFKDGSSGPVPAGTTSGWFASAADNLTADPLLVDAFNLDAPAFAPDAGSPAATGGTTPADPFFDAVTFRGAVDPANDWVAQGEADGWISFDKN